MNMDKRHIYDVIQTGEDTANFKEVGYMTT